MIINIILISVLVLSLITIIFLAFSIRKDKKKEEELGDTPSYQAKKIIKMCQKNGNLNKLIQNSADIVKATEELKEEIQQETILTYSPEGDISKVFDIGFKETMIENDKDIYAISVEILKQLGISLAL